MNILPKGYERVGFSANYMPIKLFPDVYTEKLILPHFHENIEILYCTGGYGKIFYDNTTFYMKKDDVIIINPNIIHSSPLNDEQFKYHCLLLNVEFLQENKFPENIYFEECIRDSQLSEILYSIIPDLQLLEDNDPICTENPIFIPKLRLNVLNMLLFLNNNYAKLIMDNPFNNPKFDLTKKTIMYIKEHFYEEITLDSLSKIININKYSLTRMFKKQTQMTIFEFINITRCTEAKKLIINGESITNAARQCGFINLSYFTRTYKKYIGELPSCSKFK